MDIKNNPKDKGYYNRTDFETNEGLNIKRLTKKLDIMLGKVKV